MKFKLLFYPIFLFVISTGIFAQDNFSIENEKIVEFKGMTGFWLESSDNDKLDYIIQTYSSSEKKIIELNGKDYRTAEKIFIPLSESYIAYMKSKGIAPSGQEKGAGEEFCWPIAKFDRITSTFGRRWKTFHEGIDIPAGRGTPILAAGSGRVVVARFMENYGKTIWLEHRNNMITRYCHASELLVKEGEIVKKGQIIAYVGSTGNSTGNHLHFEMRYGDFPLNPLDFLPYNPGVNKSQYMKKID